MHLRCTAKCQKEREREREREETSQFWPGILGLSLAFAGLSGVM